MNPPTLTPTTSGGFGFGGRNEEGGQSANGIGTDDDDDDGF